MPEGFVQDMPNYYDDDPWPKIPLGKDHIIDKDMSDKITSLHKQVDGFKHVVTPAAVSQAFAKAVPKWQIIMCDSKYTALPHSVWISIIENCPTKGLRYSLPVDDCNGFAISLAGWVRLNFWGINGCGWVGDFGGRHSFNVALCWNNIAPVDDKLQLLWIEPQHDNEFKIGSLPCYNAKGEGLVLFA